MNTSYYITEIEKMLEQLNINPDDSVAYNNCFRHESDKAFLRALIVFHNKICLAVDEQAEVFGSVKISGSALISGNAEISGDA